MTDNVAHRYIVIEGPIGVGKTSLARRLSSTLGGDLILEQAESNPFLERFYRDLRVDRIWEGTSEIQKVVLVNEMRKRGTGPVAAWPVEG